MVNQRNEERPRGRQKGDDRQTGNTQEEREWHGKPLQERLQILRSGQGIPSFIDKATIDDRVRWLQTEIEAPAGLSGKPKGKGQSRRGAPAEAETTGGIGGKVSGAVDGTRGTGGGPPDTR
jgi:hypothetical protein